MIQFSLKSPGFLFLVMLPLVACNNAGDSRSDKVAEKDSSRQEQVVADFTVVRQLLQESEKSDSVQMYSAGPFLFYKTGYLFDSKIRHSIALTCTDDTTFALRLYRVSDSSWALVDSMGGLKANRLMFYIESKDYNFDGTADIYIQNAYSNNYPISTGHILMIDPATKKLYRCPNSEILGNIAADYSSKLLHSESKYFGAVKPGEEKIWVRKSKWVKNHYETVDSTLETVTAPANP